MMTSPIISCPVIDCPGILPLAAQFCPGLMLRLVASDTGYGGEIFNEHWTGRFSGPRCAIEFDTYGATRGRNRQSGAANAGLGAKPQARSAVSFGHRVRRAQCDDRALRTVANGWYSQTGGRSGRRSHRTDWNLYRHVDGRCTIVATERCAIQNRGNMRNNGNGVVHAQPGASLSGTFCSGVFSGMGDLADGANRTQLDQSLWAANTARLTEIILDKTETLALGGAFGMSIEKAN